MSSDDEQDSEKIPIEAYDDIVEEVMYQVGDLVRFSSHLFPPEVGSTTYYSIDSISEHVTGIILRIKDQLLVDDHGYMSGYFVGQVSLSCQYYEVWWLDGKGITAEKHYDLELLSSSSGSSDT